MSCRTNEHSSTDDYAFYAFIVLKKLYDFAVALNGRYNYGNPDIVSIEQLENDYNQRSLEYKVSNIMQVKVFLRYIDMLGYFMTDKECENEILEGFTNVILM